MTTEAEVRFFATPAEFRDWLRDHHEAKDELWVGLYKMSSGRPSISWPESVAEALCFGWIDGLRKSIDDVSYRIRFTPRRPGSIWSSKNIAMAGDLIASGRMGARGRAAFDDRREDKQRQYSFEQSEVSLGESFAALFRANAKAWAFFGDQAPSYQRMITWWVISAKKTETQERRLAKLIRASAAGERLTA